MKDYKIDLKVKNNLLYKAMIENGYENAAELHRASGISLGVIGQLLNLKTGLYKKDGNIRDVVVKLADFLRRLPEDLIPAQHHYLGLEKNTASIELSYNELPSLMYNSGEDERLCIEDANSLINQALDSLTSREKKVINMRFGLNGHDAKSLIETGDAFNVGPERIWQIEAKALRKLRLPVRSGKLKDALDVYN